MAIKGKKQTPEHIAKRMASLRKHEKWPGGAPPKYTAETLWGKVKKGEPDECWPWTGWVNKQKYGRVELNGISYYAHRVIYDLANPGKIELKAPRNKNSYGFVRHTCDNPICCNPKHLLLGTHADNMRDKVERGRQSRPVSVESCNAKLTAENVREIRELSKNGSTRKELAEKYKVSIQTIKAVRSGRHYKDVM